MKKSDGSIELLYNNNSINYHWMHFKFRQ